MDSLLVACFAGGFLLCCVPVRTLILVLERDLGSAMGDGWASHLLDVEYKQPDAYELQLALSRGAQTRQHRSFACGADFAGGSAAQGLRDFHVDVLCRGQHLYLRTPPQGRFCQARQC